MMEKMSRLLQKMYEESGIDPNDIADSEVFRHVFFGSQVLDTYYCKFTKKTADNQGTETIIVQCHFECQTCRSMIHKPHAQILGSTECCNHYYCNPPKCFSGTCVICNKPTCSLCGMEHNQENQRFFVHKDCESKLINLIDSLLSWELRRLPLSIKINRVGRIGHG